MAPQPSRTGDRSRKSGDNTGRVHSIGRLAEEFGITTRTIRFYESVGLIKPKRKGATRIYSHRDRGRLLLILRGKNLGFSLDEIAEYIALYDADPQHIKQTRHLLEKVESTIGDLEKKRADLDRTVQELKDIRKRCRSYLKAPAKAGKV